TAAREGGGRTPRRAWGFVLLAAIVLAALPALLRVLGFRPSPLGWGVLGVLGAACLAFATRDFVQVRRQRRVVARV
ncbi:MAG TPA: hypothetical protein VNX21_08225, partial [Candidatus Thermoplasmatota archaeon]|nr:hypothetical protein [Candidatus Thermoplasmatota archaeon]